LSAELRLSGPQTLVPFANVDVSNNPTTTESEMTITVNPADPLNVAGLVHDAANLNQIQVFYTLDGGDTWSRTLIHDTGAVDNDGNGFGRRVDPTIRFDENGDLFVGYGAWNSSTNVTTLIVGKSTDGGATFANSSFRRIQSGGGYGGVDKWYLATGPAGPGTAAQAVYVAWDRPASSNQVYVAGSNDGGDSFTAPVTVDPGNGGDIFAGPAVGPNGELYVTWLSLTDGRVKVRVDPDGLWGPEPFRPTATVKVLRTGFLGLTVPAQPRRGIGNNPSIDVDRSGGPHNGRAYVAYADRIGGTNTDVFLTYSDDGGNTWSSVPATGNVENEPGTDFHPWVAVDQATGSVNVLYYTTDGDGANRDVLTRVASSTDGGATFTKADLASRRSRAAAASYTGDFLDYIGMDVRDGTVHGFWSDDRGPAAGTFVSDLDSYTARAGFRSATGGNTLVVNGDDYGPADDVIVLRRDPRNADYLDVLVNGRLQYAGLMVSVNNVAINGLAGDNTVVIADVLPGIQVTVDGGSGNNTLVGPDADNTWAVGGPNAGTLDGTVTFTDVQNLQGGAGADTFVFADGQGVDGGVDGGGGTNTLDYSAYTGNVLADLQTSQATGVGGLVANIQNVNGGNGPGYNVLVGNGGNVLSGGNARSLLIAGASAGVLIGGADDDILIGGTTQWDTDPTALTAIMAEWTQAGVSYADRVSHLLNGGGLNDPYLLNADTVTGNGGGNSLFGTAGLDLYFGALTLDAYDWDPNTETFVSV
jgi:hypothetical protein